MPAVPFWTHNFRMLLSLTPRPHSFVTIQGSKKIFLSLHNLFVWLIFWLHAVHYAVVVWPAYHATRCSVNIVIQTVILYVVYLKLMLFSEQLVYVVYDNSCRSSYELSPVSSLTHATQRKQRTQRITWQIPAMSLATSCVALRCVLWNRNKNTVTRDWEGMWTTRPDSSKTLALYESCTYLLAYLHVLTLKTHSCRPLRFSTAKVNVLIRHSYDNAIVGFCFVFKIKLWQQQTGNPRAAVVVVTFLQGHSRSR